MTKEVKAAWICGICTIIASIFLLMLILKIMVY